MDVRPAREVAVFDIDSVDPAGELIDRANVSASDLEQIGQLMNALSDLRRVEDELAAASSRYMELNRTDMRALHYLIVSQNRGAIATPSSIAEYLGISAASTTKLLDRLEAGGHIVRSPHPSDRRALEITITPETRAAALDTVGKHQARRFGVASAFSAKERQIVLNFLRDMTRELDVANAAWAHNDR